MKFNRINVHNVHELVPQWAIDPFVLARHLDSLFATEPGSQLAPTGSAMYQSLNFWIEVDAMASPPTVRVCTPDDQINLNGHLIITCSSIAHEHAQIDVPLNPIFKGFVPLAGTYSVYMHSFQTEVPLGYVGMTKQRWFDRYAQHVSSARTGSPFLFHQALRKHHAETVLHKVFMNGIDHDRALEYEEKWIGMFGLYPLGLNMIPGGLAGFAYLAKLGLQARTAEARDSVIEQLSTSVLLEGRPNPLCAARWETDSNFVERVVCGHSGRLTAEQVRLIRIGTTLGKSLNTLVKESSARNVRQVQNVLAGRTYVRIK
jgi:hypothetical protein